MADFHTADLHNADTHAADCRTADAHAPELFGGDPAPRGLSLTDPAGGHAPLEAQSPYERAYAPLPDASGDLVQDPDFTLPTTAGPLPWRLFYYSEKAAVNSEWGYGRRASFPLRLCADTGGGITTVCLEREDGSGVRYSNRATEGGAFSPVSPRTFDTLVKNGDGSWDETRLDSGATFHYPAGSFSSLSYYQTVHGRRVTLSYAGGLLQTIEEPAGRQIVYGYDGDNHVETVTDWAGRVHTFTYSIAGEMASMQGPCGEYTYFDHDDGHHLTSITAPDGFETTFTYDDRGKVLTRSVDGALGTYEDLGMGTAYTDPLGHTWTTWTDDNGNVTKIVDPPVAYRDPTTRTSAFRQAKYDVGGHGLPVWLQDALGRVTTRTYRDDGRLLTHTDPLGNTTTHTWDSYGNPRTEVDPLGRTTTYQYEGDGATRLLLSLTEPSGRVTTYTHTDWGVVHTEATPLGAVTTHAWSALGLLDSVTDPLGNITTYGYDAAGNTTSVMDAEGRVTLHTYDNEGRPVTTTDPTGAVWTTLYDPAGNVWQQVSPLGHTATTLYDARQQPTWHQDERSQVWTHTYDLKGRPLATHDPLGNRTTQTHDEADRRVQHRDARGNPTTFGYDPARQLRAQHTTLPSAALTHYDRAGRVDAHIDELGNRTTTIYDASGAVIATIDPLGNRATTVYDTGGRVWVHVSPTGARTTQLYDLDGRQHVTIDALGNRTTSSFDAAGRVVSVINALGEIATVAYDRTGLAVAHVDPLGNRATVGYDAAGREWWRMDPNGNVTTTVYDRAGRVWAHQDARGGLTTSTYDEAGNPVALTDPLGHVTTTVYDERGLAVATQDALGAWAYVDHDEAGNPWRRTDARGNVTTYGYDDLNRVTGALYPDGSRVTHLYDLASRQTGLMDATGSMSYGYDAAGRLTTHTYREGHSLTYAYDGSGKRVRMSSPAGVTTYNYDAAERLAGVVNPFGETTTLEYDALHRESRRTLGNGVTVSHGYDAAGRQTVREIRQAGGAALAVYTATYDAGGRRTGVSELDGSQVVYGYDERDQLVEEQRTGIYAYHLTYTYDALGNRLSKSWGGLLTTYAFDAVNQMTLVSPAGEPAEAQSYDLDGNLIGRSAGGALTTYTWDFENRLTEVKTPEGLVETYTYNALDRRATRQSTRDLSARQHAFFTHAGGALDAERHLATGVSAFPGFDLSGNTRLRTDGAGAATDGYAYTAFGEVIEDGADAAHDFGGESGYYRDEDSRLYVRARHLDVENGRWLSRDPIGVAGGLNLYGYVGNDPVTGSDPSGHQKRHENDDPFGSLLLTGNWNSPQWKVEESRAAGRQGLLVGASALGSAFSLSTWNGGDARNDPWFGFSKRAGDVAVVAIAIATAGKSLQAGVYTRAAQVVLMRYIGGGLGNVTTGAILSHALGYKYTAGDIAHDFTVGAVTNVPYMRYIKFLQGAKIPKGLKLYAYGPGHVNEARAVWATIIDMPNKLGVKPKYWKIGGVLGGKTIKEGIPIKDTEGYVRAYLGDVFQDWWKPQAGQYVHPQKLLQWHKYSAPSELWRGFSSTGVLFMISRVPITIGGIYVHAKKVIDEAAKPIR